MKTSARALTKLKTIFFRNDPFSQDLLPQEVPQLYDGLSEEDKAQIEEDEETPDDAIELTPEMVNSMFQPITSPPVDEKTKKEAQ